jgi:type IX secretion system PorP/SprF family membrane protein
MKNSLFIGLLLFICIKSIAQIDPHFSQLYSNPSWLNPALTGVFDAKGNANVIYRSQWESVVTPFKTISANTNLTLKKNLSIGFNFLNQTAGSGGYVYNTGHLTLAYNGIKFGSFGDKHIVFGMSVGIIDKYFDISKFEVGEQWNALTGFNPNASISDNVTNIMSKPVFDVSAGLYFYNTNEVDRNNYFIGIAAAHINGPSDNFFEGNQETVLPIRYTVNAGMKIEINESLFFHPIFIYQQQGTATEIIPGTYLQFMTNDNTSLTTGVNYRVNDAIVPFVGIKLNNADIGISYDINNSALGKLVANTSAVEISARFIFGSFDNETYLCPRF